MAIIGRERASLNKRQTHDCQMAVPSERLKLLSSVRVPSSVEGELEILSVDC